MMIKFGGALIVGAPVAVLYRWVLCLILICKWWNISRLTVFQEVTISRLLSCNFINNIQRFQREQLAIDWREWMTDRTLQLYNSNRVYYALERDVSSSNSASTEQAPVGKIDNPDHRYIFSLWYNLCANSYIQKLMLHHSLSTGLQKMYEHSRYSAFNYSSLSSYPSSIWYPSVWYCTVSSLNCLPLSLVMRRLVPWPRLILVVRCFLWILSSWGKRLICECTVLCSC
jgi:hypothetical protein